MSRVVRKREKNSLKVNDRCGNVYENKGSAFSSPWRSGNVIENEGSYALKSGNVIDKKGGRWWVVGGRWGKNRIQDPGFREKTQAHPPNPES
jgi:hypothetical protein